MLLNYITIAIRNLTRHKEHSIINIIGLAVGIAASLILYMVISAELSYNGDYKNYKNLYHIVTVDKNSGEESCTSGIPFPALEALRIDFPQVKMTGIHSSYGTQVTTLEGNKKFNEDMGLFFVEPQFFELFDCKWLAGTEISLKEPNTVVLSRSVADKYFGNWHKAIGQLLLLDNALTLKVVGVVENIPYNSDFPLRIICSFETFKKNPSLYGYTTDWGSTTSNFHIYMLLPDKVAPSTINKQLIAFSDKQYKNKGNSGKRYNHIRPLSEVHFDTNYSNFGMHITSKTTLWTLTLIGILIIIMACINFINLSTAQAISRSKEVGIRKVLGSTRGQLLWQILGETAVIVALSGIIALIISYFSLPYMQKFLKIEGDFSIFSINVFVYISILTTAITFLSGLYPSYIISKFTPISAIKNKVNSAFVGRVQLRRGLVVVQFIIAQILIIGTIVATSQMSYIRYADLGFNKEALFLLGCSSDSASTARKPAFKHDLQQIAGIENVSFSSDVPSSNNNWSTNFAYNGGKDEKFSLFLKFADENYFSTYGLTFVAGRAYKASDTISEVVVNETLLEKLNIKNPQEAIGKTIRLGGNAFKPIVGVVKDFKTNTLRENIKPLMISPRTKHYNYAGIKLKTKNMARTQAEIQALWDKYYPEYVYSSAFLDENIAKYYEQEELLATLYKVFAGIAILISCLGLYGLVSFMVVQKTKEVGIRKVLGASVEHIVYLFSKEFTVLITIAFLIAAPIAYYLMSDWLSNFVYRVNLGVGVFLLAIIVSMFIAWITVGYKAVKAALANPVKSLRTE